MRITALTFGTEVNWIGVPTLKEALEKVNKELVGPYALGSSRFQSLPFPSSFPQYSINTRTVISIFHRLPIHPSNCARSP